MPFDPGSLEGAQAVVTFFGKWPSFHDAEVVSISLKRNDICRFSIHTFTITSELDRSGRYQTTNHGIVTFEIAEIHSLLLKDFNEQNVLSGLEISQEDDGTIKFDMSSLYGLDGFISGRRACVSVEAGIPPDSAYKGNK